MLLLSISYTYTKTTLLCQIRIYAKSTCVHVLLQWRCFITCVVENRTPEWSVTCSLAFLIRVMRACAYSLYCAWGLPQGSSLEKK